MAHSLDGIYAAVVTPFDEQDRLAPAQLPKHLHLLQAKGCHGVLVGGTTGEAASLSVNERNLLIKAACECGTSLKILAGTGAASLEDAVYLTRGAFDVGVDAVVVIPPYFYRDVPQEGLCLFYESLIKRAVPADGRMLLYHNPVATATQVDVDLIRWLCDRFPDRIAGIKDSSSDLKHGTQLCVEFPQLRVFVGDDRLLSSMLNAGGAGAITGLANLFPDLLRNIFDSFREGQPLDDMQSRLTEAHAKLNGLPRIAAIKTLLVSGGVIAQPHVRPPLRSLTEEELHLLRERFHLELPFPDRIDLSAES